VAGGVPGLALFCAGYAAHGHDHNRPDLDAWYPTLRSGKGSCCDGPGTDALHLRDADWTIENGHYRVRIPKDGAAFHAAIVGEEVDTVWVDAPDDAIIDAPNRDGTTLVWPIYGYLLPSVRCFLPGTMS
jgi:hypothetical protein